MIRTTVVVFLFCSLANANLSNRQLQDLPGGCQSFFTSGFNLESPEAINFFTQDSFITLAQTGTYVGPGAIAEYVAFAGPSTPFIEVDDPVLLLPTFMGYAPDPATKDVNKSLCQITAGLVTRTQLSDTFSMTGHLTFERGTLLKFFWDPVNKKIDHIYVYYETDFLEYFFKSLDTPETASLVCSAMLSDDASECVRTADANSITTLKECVTQFESLPLAESDMMYVDGNTKGCRFIHGVFSTVNPFHCPHLSFEPLEDADGAIKCQTSKFVNPLNLFTGMDLIFWDNFKTQVGFRPGTSIHLIGLNEWVCPRGFSIGSKMKKGKDQFECKSLCKQLPGRYELDETAQVPLCVAKAPKGKKGTKTGAKKGKKGTRKW